MLSGQNELRNIAREAKKFNQPRQKKTFSQVQTVTNRQDFEGHLQRLQLVFDRLRKHGLKLKPSKCHLMKKEVQYLGHRVCAEGIRTDPEKISKVKDWPQPTNRKEVLRFLGFAGYYRRFVESYAKIAAPLYRLTSGDPRKKKRGWLALSLGCWFTLSLPSSSIFFIVPQSLVVVAAG
uniref:ribonuclease H n=1 Tax=Knipowitschia caucasica TaxID=637954 RepID=A0AAV2LBN6_KNICA